MLNQQRHNHKPARLLLLGLTVALTFVAQASADEQKSGKHLFILSGQSNMTGGLKSAFAARVEKHFGKENAVVVMRARGGRGIRFWVADYRQPPGRGLSEKKMKNSNGTEYKRLIEATLAATKDQSFASVGFIWMQGESDANNRLSETYEESFHKLVNQLKKDLKRNDLYFVIGRINDYARSRQPNDHWVQVRETQVKLGKTPGNAWINTDDLNGGDAKQPDGDIHFPKEGAVTLGQRFADKAIELIAKP